MPELPEVETTLRGILPHVSGRQIKACTVRQRRLRIPVPGCLERNVVDKTVVSVSRRAKYLLFGIGAGHMLVHLGMSGSLRLVAPATPVEKHDHVDWQLSSGQVLRFRDPRRFGIVSWIENDPLDHTLLSSLGPEPLGASFTGDYLHQKAGGRKVPVKAFIMNSQVVVGVGNIYANEALFHAGIHPLRDAGKISLLRYIRLVDAIKSVLSRAISQGGTTLRDFVGGDGNPGYFVQSLNVYGRGGGPCEHCGRTLKESRLSNRTTVYCSSCQR